MEGGWDSEVVCVNVEVMCLSLDCVCPQWEMFLQWRMHWLQTYPLLLLSSPPPRMWPGMSSMTVSLVLSAMTKN